MSRFFQFWRIGAALVAMLPHQFNSATYAPFRKGGWQPQSKRRFRRRGSFSTRTLQSFMGTMPANHRKPIDPAEHRRQLIRELAP